MTLPVNYIDRYYTIKTGDVSRHSQSFTVRSAPAIITVCFGMLSVLIAITIFLHRIGFIIDVGQLDPVHAVYVP